MSQLAHTIPTIEVADETYDINKSAFYELQLEVNTNGFTYATYDLYSNSFIQLKSFEIPDFFHLDQASVEKYLNQIDEFMRDYKNVKISINHHKYVLVPNVLLDESRLENYYSFQYTLKDDESLLSNKIISAGCTAVFPVKKSLLNALGIKFEQARFYHAVTGTLEALIKENKNNSGTTIYLDVQPEHFHVIVFKDKNLEFCNSFLHKDPEDILYYVLNIFDQMNINPSLQIIRVSAQTALAGRIHELLKKYIQHVEIQSRNFHFKFSPAFYSLKTEAFHSLFNLKHCV